MKFILQAKEVMSLQKPPSDLTLKCLDGTLWVTCEGDRTDHILAPGMTYQRTGSGKVAMTALTDVHLCLLDPAANELKAPTISLLPT